MRAALDPSSQGGEAHGHTDQGDEGYGGGSFGQLAPLPAVAEHQGPQAAEQVGDGVEVGDGAQPAGQLAAGT